MLTRMASCPPLSLSLSLPTRFVLEKGNSLTTRMLLHASSAKLRNIAQTGPIASTCEKIMNNEAEKDRGRRRKKRRTRNGKPSVGTPTPKLTKTYLQVRRTHRQSPPVTQFICWLWKSSKCIIDREAPGFLVGYNTRNRRNMINRCEEGREGGEEVASDGWVCGTIAYCSIATISQPPTIRISHQCCIMEQIMRLRIYCHSSTGKIAQIWNILNISYQDKKNCNWRQIVWKIRNMLTFVPVVPINIPPHKCVKSAKTRRYLRDSRDSLAAERSPKKLDWTSEAHHTHHNTTTQTSTKHTQSNNYTHDKQPKTKKATTFFLSGHIKL